MFIESKGRCFWALRKHVLPFWAYDLRPVKETDGIRCGAYIRKDQ